MDFYLFLVIVAATIFLLLGITFYMVYGVFRIQENTIVASLPSPQSSVPKDWKHHVFPSFHGADIRKSFLSHILKEFRSKGISPFIDNNIERSKSIGPELIDAIKGSRIAIVLLSRNYASSTWCLNELVEIMKCRGELSQTVMAVFYEVDPSHVKKQTGDFGKVFRNTCKGKTKEEIERWRQALVEVAQIAGYDSKNWATEVEMIEKIASDVSNKLFNSTESRDFDGFIGMGSHLEKIDLVLNRDLDEVKMIGIWGPAGIGKSTIARCFYNKHSKDFQLSVFMENIKSMYNTLPVSSDDYSTKLYFQQKLMSHIINEKDLKVTHLGVAKDRLNDKRVLVVLDDVDHSVQLEAMAKETEWFGDGSLIIITTQNLRLLEAHGINHIYKVNLPGSDEALEIFCMYAFGKKYPKDGFEELSWEVVLLAGFLPLGLRVIGSHFKNMRKEDWIEELPSLRNSLDGEIESILKFSYDALGEEEKILFLHLTCFSNFRNERVEDYLSNTFNIKKGLRVLAEKSFLYTDGGHIEIHNLLRQLGRKIVRDQSVSEPGKRQFLMDAGDIRQVLSDDTSDSSSVIGIDFTVSNHEDELCVSERAFGRMTNLQFLQIYGNRNGLYFTQNLKSISRKLIYLEWNDFPMTCLPCNFNPEFLVLLNITSSKLERLWEGERTRPLRNLKWMELSGSIDLKELPDLSTATTLEHLYLEDCSSLVELPFSIGNATNLELLELSRCSSLVKLPSSIGNLTNLTRLSLGGCSSLVELPSCIGNVTNLEELILYHCSSLLELPLSIGNLDKLSCLLMSGCSKLKGLPTNINMESLESLHLNGCTMLKSFPEISTNIKDLELVETPIEEFPLAIRSWSRLEEFHMSYSEKLKDLPQALDSITDLYLTNTEIQELGPWVKGFSRLRRLVLKEMHNLVSLPQLPDSLSKLDAENCTSLERLDCSFRNPDISLNFLNCFKLNQEARDLIIQTSNRCAAILPGEQVPAYFSDRATGGTLTVKLNKTSPLQTCFKFKSCIVLVDKDDYALQSTHMTSLSYKIMDKENGLLVPCRPKFHDLPPAVRGHLYTSEFEIDVTSNDLIVEPLGGGDSWGIKECGLLQLS